MNAACPGEATGGFISATDPDDNGCRTFRAQYPLHVAYPGTQLQFATGFLRHHARTALVSIMLGANDGFRLESQCAGDLSCVLRGAPALLKTITRNLATAVRAMRATHYRGPIMIVDYYSTDYTNAAQTLLSSTLDGTLRKLARRHRLLLADGFAAMKRAAASAGGNTCAAGLLNVSPSDPTGCDVHPSQAGHRVLASAVKRSYLAWKRAHSNA